MSLQISAYLILILSAIMPISNHATQPPCPLPLSESDNHLMFLRISAYQPSCDLALSASENHNYWQLAIMVYQHHAPPMSSPSGVDLYNIILAVCGPHILHQFSCFLMIPSLIQFMFCIHIICSQWTLPPCSYLCICGV